MPDHSISKETSLNPNTGQAGAAAGVERRGTDATNAAIHSLVGLSSVGIIGCFFLPWIRILFSDASGYDLQRLPADGVKFLWVIPITAAIALVSAVTKQTVRGAGLFAGMMPFLVLYFYGSKIGKGIFDAMRPGAYLTLLLAAVLLVAPQFLRNTKG